MAITVALLLVTLLLVLVFTLLINQFKTFGDEWPKLQEKLIGSYNEVGCIHGKGMGCKR